MGKNELKNPKKIVCCNVYHQHEIWDNMIYYFKNRQNKNVTLSSQCLSSSGSLLAKSSTNT